MKANQRRNKHTEQQHSTEQSDRDLAPATFGVEGIEDAEDAAEADLDERVADLWGWSA